MTKKVEIQPINQLSLFDGNKIKITLILKLNHNFSQSKFLGPKDKTS